MNFCIAGLDPGPFLPLFALSGAALGARGVQRVPVTERPAAPCRVTLDDAEIGEEVLLLSYEHQPAATAYRQQGPIFVRNTAARFEAFDAIPPALMRRMLSLRGYDDAGAMVEADIIDGVAAGDLIKRMLRNESVAYIHAHYARRGCFAARIDRSS
ncbi:MAG: DUF1203 domain-containing protein [Terricaulis sp.]